MNFSGAGLTFYHSNNMYLTGVTSVTDSNPNKSLLNDIPTIFTNIYRYLKWIRNVYDKYGRNVSISGSTDISIILLILLY